MNNKAQLDYIEELNEIWPDEDPVWYTEMKQYDLDQVKALAELQRTTEDYDSPIGFDFAGQWIIDPWMDETGRWSLTDEEAVQYYGSENIKKFIQMASAQL